VTVDRCSLSRKFWSPCCVEWIDLSNRSLCHSMKPRDMKIKTAKILLFEISTMPNFEWVILTWGSGDEVMAFYWHFQPSDTFLTPADSCLHPLAVR